MKLTVTDIKIIFSTDEIMNKIVYRRGCMLWKGSFSDKREPIIIMRFEGKLRTFRALDIISALMMDTIPKKRIKKCGTKNCLNPMHYS